MIDDNLDDFARWLLDLEEFPELSADRDFLGDIEERYQNTVSLDLDTRTQVLSSLLLENAKHHKFNKNYLIKLANRLITKCRLANREDLSIKIINIIALL